jgi:hypothetical protein
MEAGDVLGGKQRKCVFGSVEPWLLCCDGASYQKVRDEAFNQRNGCSNTGGRVEANINSDFC